MKESNVNKGDHREDIDAASQSKVSKNKLEQSNLASYVHLPDSLQALSDDTEITSLRLVKSVVKRHIFINLSKKNNQSA